MRPAQSIFARAQVRQYGSILSCLRSLGGMGCIELFFDRFSHVFVLARLAPFRRRILKSHGNSGLITAPQPSSDKGNRTCRHPGAHAYLTKSSAGSELFAAVAVGRTCRFFGTASYGESSHMTNLFTHSLEMNLKACCKSSAEV
jgi:hypothetical protein